jgi:hypothetical protein
MPIPINPKPGPGLIFHDDTAWVLVHRPRGAGPPVRCRQCGAANPPGTKICKVCRKKL